MADKAGYLSAITMQHQCIDISCAYKQTNTYMHIISIDVNCHK